MKKDYREEMATMKRLDLFPLSWAALELEKQGLKIKAVTLRKYCIAGRYGRKLGGSWLLTVEEIKAIAAMGPETRKAGRPKGSGKKPYRYTAQERELIALREKIKVLHKANIEALAQYARVNK